MTMSTANPEPVASAPAQFFQLMRSTAAEVRGMVGRVLRAAMERVQTVVRRLRAATSDVAGVPESQTATRTGPAVATGQAASQVDGLRAARALSVLAAVVMAVASAVGLWWKQLYQDPAPAVAMFRGYDLVSLAVATPVLAGALVGAHRGSPRAQLLWAGMLAYAFYTYAYYVFGAAFNALFLVHIVLLVLSVVALVLVLTNLDVGAIAEGFRDRTPVRLVSGLLAFLAAGLGGMWIYYSLRYAMTGAALPEGALVQPPPILRLGYVMDLATLVPSYAAAAWLLWRRHPWGYALATVLLTASGVIQLDYMIALLFQTAAKVPGATPFDPQEPFIAAAIFGAAAALLVNLRRVRQDPMPPTATS